MALALAARRQLIPPGAAYVAPLLSVHAARLQAADRADAELERRGTPDVLAHYGQIFERAVYLKVLGNTLGSR